MDFGGNQFTYVSKKKVDKVRNMRQNQPLSSIKESKDELLLSTNLKPDLNKVSEKEKKLESEKSEKIDLRGRSRSRSRSRSKDKKKMRARSRSNSIEMNNSQELDAVYSCDELEDNDDDDEEEEDSFNFNSKSDVRYMDTRMDEQERSYKPQKAKKEKKKRQQINLAEMKKTEDKVYEHEVDTNILSIKFAFLSEKVGYATGDPTFCKNCNSVLNKDSKLKPYSDKEDDTSILWECEFCNFSNIIQIEKEEIPKSDCIDYFVMSKNQVKSTDLNFSDEKTVIFCFDTSGSMCVTTPIKGKHKFKGNTIDKELQELMKFSDGSDQFYDQGSKGKTYISRIQCLQAAIESNLTLMKESSPNIKIGFVTFNNEVKGIGDGTQQEVKINGNNLNDAEFIRNFGQKSVDIIKKPIKDTFDSLLKHLYSIEENGQTALGPAVLFAVNLLNSAALGSKIILCTDGIANIGISAIEGVHQPEDLDKLDAFYKEVGKQAKEKGIIISLITFEGEESKISILSNLAQETGGDIIRVKPAEILEQFSNLLTTEVVATNVKIHVKLHKIMKFRNEKPEDLKDHESTLIKDIGNATNETELYVEYQFKHSEDIGKMEDIDLDKLTNVPFQSIIYYTSKNGDKCIRVLTSSQKISSEKDEVQKQAKYNLISVNALQKSSNLAKEGKYREAQSNALAWKKMIKHNIKSNESSGQAYMEFNKNMNHLNNDLQLEQFNEINDNNNFGHLPMNMGGMGSGLNTNINNFSGYTNNINNNNNADLFSNIMPSQNQVQNESEKQRNRKQNKKDNISSKIHNLSNMNTANMNKKK